MVQALTRPFALPDGLVARFATDWQRIAPHLPAGRTVGLAVSGGPDSLALLALAHATFPGRFAVATVDHGLRSAAAEEAADVARLCAVLDVPHTTLTLALAPGSAVQERARIARYAALGDWLDRTGLTALATAHHADDQAETLVMRFNRGAGLRGLAGMRPIAGVPGHGAPLLRPLLGWRRSELAEVVAMAGFDPANDPSNADIRFERVRVRHGLAAAAWIDPDGLAASAAHLAEADAALDWVAGQAGRAVEEATGGELVWTAQGLPRVIALRVLEGIIARLGGSAPRGGDLARWHDALAAGGVATLAGVRGDARHGAWRFVRVPPHRRPGDSSPSAA